MKRSPARGGVFLALAMTAAAAVAALAGCATTDERPAASKAAASDAPASGAPALPPAIADGEVAPEYAYAAGLAIGRRLGERLKEDELRADHRSILRGVEDGLSGAAPKYPQDQMDLAIARIESRVLERQARQRFAADPSFRKMAEENAARSRELIERASRMEGVEALPDGALVKTLREGDGRYVGAARAVKANFTVSLADGAKVHASTPGTPAEVVVAVLPDGLVEVVRSMRVGSHLKVALPPDRAFGLAGRPPAVGPNQALIFDIELVAAE